MALTVAPFCFTRSILPARVGPNDTATYPNYTRTLLQQDPAYPSAPGLPHQASQRPLSEQLTCFISPVSTTIFAQPSKGGSHKVGKKKTAHKANVFSAAGIAFVWNAFKGSRSSSQHFSCIYAYFLSSHWPLPTLLNAPPFWSHTKT